MFLKHKRIFFNLFLKNSANFINTKSIRTTYLLKADSCRVKKNHDKFVILIFFVCKQALQPNYQ